MYFIFTYLFSRSFHNLCRLRFPILPSLSSSWIFSILFAFSQTTTSPSSFHRAPTPFCPPPTTSPAAASSRASDKLYRSTPLTSSCRIWSITADKSSSPVAQVPRPRASYSSSRLPPGIGCHRLSESESTSSPSKAIVAYFQQMKHHTRQDDADDHRVGSDSGSDDGNGSFYHYDHSCGFGYEFEGVSGDAIEGLDCWVCVAVSAPYGLCVTRMLILLRVGYRMMMRLVLQSIWSGQNLSSESPQLYWLCITFLAFDVFFLVICVAVACVVGIAVCCCLPCIIASLCPVADDQKRKRGIFRSAGKTFERYFMLKTLTIFSKQFPMSSEKVYFICTALRCHNDSICLTECKGAGFAEGVCRFELMDNHRCCCISRH
ncbi:unnamed protein product [Lactuca virosa]|uniref:Uncharacterized protein n=1 Tax=Lactuca virosa TaxID=75947 RepID=A0AAU9NT58_9ASTR|nr:unnamed protein product [Lactuca virosa]